MSVASSALPREDVGRYPRPPGIEPAGARLRGLLAGEVIFDTTEAVRVVETHHAPTYYVPPDAVRVALAPNRFRSACEWKGIAQYWDLSAGGRSVARAAWSYADPDRAFAGLKDHLAFYATALDEAWVGDERASAQAGGFYGGWVTSNLVGSIKGPPGTEGW